MGKLKLTFPPSLLLITLHSSLFTVFIGCVATQRDVLDLSNQMDELGSQLSTMQKNQADLALKMDDLNSTLTHFSENLNDFQNQTSQLSAKIDDLQSSMSQKVEAVGEALKTQQEEIKKKQQEIESMVLPTRVYQDAHRNFSQKKYDLAINGFRLYLEKFPKGEMADKCYYYLGEALTSKSDWKEAAKAYATLLDKFPQTTLTPAARLKYALAILNLGGGYREEATRYLKSVISDFPSSSQAKIAKDHLVKLESSTPPKPKPQPK